MQSAECHNEYYAFLIKAFCIAKKLYRGNLKLKRDAKNEN